MTELSFKRKHIFTYYPCEIFSSGELLATINCKSFLARDFHIETTEGPKWTLKIDGLFAPKVIIKQNNEEIGFFKFNWRRNKGTLTLNSGSIYQFSSPFLFLSMKGHWVGEDGRKLIEYKQNFSLLRKEGKILLEDFNADDSKLLAYLGIQFLTLREIWTSSSG